LGFLKTKEDLVEDQAKEKIEKMAADLQNQAQELHNFLVQKGHDAGKTFLLFNLVQVSTLEAAGEAIAKSGDSQLISEFQEIGQDIGVLARIQGSKYLRMLTLHSKALEKQAK
jgi:hypothetical protein